jgi:hypothetical protein
MATSSVKRRAVLGVVLVLPIGACGEISGLSGERHPYTLSLKGDKLVRWIQVSGHDNMMAPEALALMGITNEDRDIPVRQLGQDGSDGRYVVSLVNIRKIHELIFHRRQGDVLILHLSDTGFTRLASVRYPKNGKPALITDTAFAESDYQQQVTFWLSRLPAR